MSIKIHKKELNLQDILSSLMKESVITEAELARQTKVPQTTINRILNSPQNPRANTLKPIAKFFGVTIGQLCGFEALSPYRVSGETNPTNRAAWSSIPIIEWEQVKSWLFESKNLTPLNHTQWIISEKHLSDKSFALKSLASMEPRFRRHSTLIIDPETPFKDGHYIIIALDGINPTVRKVIKDGADCLLKSFDKTQPLIKLSKKHLIYGPIIETRMEPHND